MSGSVKSRAPGVDGIPPYPGDLAALDRYEREGRGFVEVSPPRGASVVLGRATPVSDVIMEACAEDGVPVYRRRGGGGAVVLAPGMVVITVCFPLLGLPDVELLIRDLAGVVARALVGLAPDGGRGPAVAGIRGFGDVCLGDRKVLGSSVYLRRSVGLYQGSLLVRDCRVLMDRYLAHPSREPAYRAGRAHSAFVTSLEEHGFPVDPQVLGERLRSAFDSWPILQVR